MTQHIRTSVTKQNTCCHQIGRTKWQLVVNNNYVQQVLAGHM